MTEIAKAAVRKPRIFALNIMRVFIIAAVISTHIMSSGYLYDTPLSGAVWMISHTSRNLFVFITALVLMYNYGAVKKFNVKAFYLKRFTLVLLPYATWTLIYQIKDGIMQSTTADFVNEYIHNFLTAGAMYHLYFLLITMQIYLLFPLIRIVYQKIKASPKTIMAVSVALQLVMTAVMHFAPSGNALSWWLQNPDNYVLGYQLYVVAGLVFAMHLEAIVKVVMEYKRKMYVASALIFAGGLVFYFLQISFGVEAAYAAAVFQPYLVIASIFYGLSLIAFSFQWVKKGMRFSKPIAAISEDSFGIYLSHVLFITYFAKYLQSDAANWYVGLATLVVGLPVFYAAGFVFSEIARRTWFSVLLTGRKMTPITFSAPKKRPQHPEVSLVRAKSDTTA